MRAHGERERLMTHLRRRCTPESDLAAAELIYGELVGNVIRHTCGGIRVRLLWINGRAVLCVRDRGRGFHHDFRLPDATSETGRGLFIVRRLAHDLRVECDPDGCEVTAVLPVVRLVSR